MHLMDDNSLDELQRLRARAYGPSADITHDVAALRRLRELETTARPSSEADVPPDWSDQPQPAPNPAVSTACTFVARVPPPVPAVPRRVRLLWVSSVVAAAVLAAFITYAVTSIRPIDTASGAQHVATLSSSPIDPILVGWLGADTTSHMYDYFGYTIFETVGVFAASSSACLTVIRTDHLPKEEIDSSNWSFDGPMYMGCEVGLSPPLSRSR
jgi:hypothetical protein